MNKIVGTILSTMFGLAFLVAAFYGVATEYKSTPVHTTHLVLFLLLGLLGASLIPWVGQLIVDRVRAGVGLAGDYADHRSGRRASQGEVTMAPVVAPASAAAENPLAGKGTIDDGGKAP
jgi:glycerol uptake facilitator-like aquaporin